MGRRKKEKPLTDEEVLTFWDITRKIVKVHRECEEKEDFDAYEALINQLYSCGVEPDEFREFAEIIEAANDPSFRSPK